MYSKLLLTLLLTLFFSFIARADDKWILDIPKDSTVVLKCSSQFFGFQRWNAWNGRTSYSAEIGKSGDGDLTINGESNWRYKGWAWMQQLILKKVSRENKKTVVELRTGNANVKLFLGSEITDINAALKEILFVGNVDLFMDSKYYKTEILDLFLPNIFYGKLADIPLKTQLNLIEAAKFDHKAIDGETFKGKFYLVIRGDDDIQYNTIQINQAERTSKTVEKIINFGISKMPDIINTQSIDGIKVEMKVFFRDFLRQTLPDSENTNAYFLFDDLKQFKEADITNQQLVDKSFVLVNGNRVQVSLTQFR